ncbi:MAG: glutamine-hydrolyzing carbamoyl-phosphate synthase small subunit [Candidatus Eiseniibacteriota bacterium]
MNRWANSTAILALEDGRVFHGRSFGAPGTRAGEVVFNTAMTGYQEVYSDPSYAGQIVCLTYPLIGNYGVNDQDFESVRFHAEGVIVREHCEHPSSWRMEGRLSDWLEERGVVAMAEVDTRALTRYIRSHGELRAVISTEELDPERAVALARASQGLLGADLASRVTCPAPYVFARGERGRVVVYDYGVKRNILRELALRGFEVAVVPSRTDAADVLAQKPVGVVLSNGPGDPAAVQGAPEAVGRILGQVPVLGICLGHQITALALGARTSKLKFGHHGANHPVLELATGRISVTSQNHGFVVDESTLPEGCRVSHRSLNDGAVEGLECERLALVSVQYHPESSPGPHDSKYLFDRFAELTETRPTRAAVPAVPAAAATAAATGAPLR